MLDHEYHRKYDEICDLYTDDSNKKMYGDTYPYYVVQFETIKNEKLSFQMNFDDELLELVCKLEEQFGISDARFLHKNHIVTLQELVGDVFRWRNVTLILDEIDEYLIKTKQEEQSFVVMEISSLSIPFNDEDDFNFENTVDYLEAEDEDLFFDSVEPHDYALDLFEHAKKMRNLDSDLDLNQFFSTIKDGLEKVAEIRDLQRDEYWNDKSNRFELIGKKSPRMFQFYDGKHPRPQEMDPRQILNFCFFKISDFHGFCSLTDDRKIYGVILNPNSEKQKPLCEYLIMNCGYPFFMVQPYLDVFDDIVMIILSSLEAKKKTSQTEDEGKILTTLSIDEKNANMEGLLSFEELDGSAFEFYSGKTSQLKEDSDDSGDEDFKAFDEEFEREEAKKKKKKKQKKKTEEIKQDEEETEQKKLDMSKWDALGLPETIINNLEKMKFTKPTAVQEAAVPKGIKNSADILIAAETGSGKTLAFGIPIVTKLLKDRTSNKKGLKGLILTPTRELALQISKHFKPIIKDTKLTCATIVGGMSSDKQQRLISYQPDIIVATTGRYWDLVSQQNIEYLQNFQNLKYFVLDEADRMISDGHFKELKQILELIKDQRSGYKKPPKIQNYVCSATLTLSSKFKYKAKKKDDDQKTIDQLMELLEIDPNGNNSEIIDLTTSNQMAKSLTESQIQCLIEDKSLYVYYFTFMYPGRTLVFANSISNVRRLYGVLNLLEVPSTILHGELQQKQRLKNLEKFQKNDNCVLISTDVAARGIDIQGVKYVIHYELPTSTDGYVHRCGRTGRAFSDGFSVALVTPADKKIYLQICNATHKPNGIDPFPIEEAYLKDLRLRIKLATTIEEKYKKHKKDKTNASWFVQNAKEMDIEIDDTFFPGIKSQAKHELKDRDLERAKEKLKQELKRPIKNEKRLSKRYLTYEPLRSTKTNAKEDFDMTNNSKKRKRE
eukprot:gene804-9054_t